MSYSRRFFHLFVCGKRLSINRSETACQWVYTLHVTGTSYANFRSTSTVKYEYSFGAFIDRSSRDQTRFRDTTSTPPFLLPSKGNLNEDLVDNFVSTRLARQGVGDLLHMLDKFWRSGNCEHTMITDQIKLLNRRNLVLMTNHGIHTDMACANHMLDWAITLKTRARARADVPWKAIDCTITT